MIHEMSRCILPIERNQIGAKHMSDVVMCVMWIVSAIIAMTGIIIMKNIDFAIWIMVIPLLVSIFT